MLDEFDDSLESKHVQRNNLRHRDLPNTLEIVCRKSSLSDGSSVNRSIVTATEGAPGREWKGPILAMKIKGWDDVDLPTYKDTRMRDFRDVVDYFNWCKEDSVQAEEVVQQDIRKSKIRGVMITCKGDKMAFGTEEFTSMDVSAEDPIFGEPIVPISRLVGMNLHTIKYTRDRFWEDEYDDDYSVDDDYFYENVPASLLHLDVNDSNGGWGCAPVGWQSGVGNVLVVRSDRQDVSIQEVKDICNFCQFKISPIIAKAQILRAQVMGVLTPEGYEKYLAEEMRRKEVDTSEDAEMQGREMDGQG